MIRYATIVVLFTLCVTVTHAQTTTDAVLKQSLLAHLGTGGFPTDLTIEAQLTDRSGTRPMRIQTKGKDKVRYELGTGSQMTVSIFNGGSGWTGPLSRLRQLPEHAAVRRAPQIPFLDVIADLENPRFKAFDRGLERVGASTLRHIGVRLSDPTPRGRFLNRPLHEDVELFMDPATNLIVRSQRLLTADDSMDFRVPSILDFSDFRVVGALTIPFRVVNTVGTPSSGMYRSTLVIHSVAVNQGIAESVFQPR